MSWTVTGYKVSNIKSIILFVVKIKATVSSVIFHYESYNIYIKLWFIETKALILSKQAVIFNKK